MKRFFGYAIILASLSVPAFAAKNSQNVTLSLPATVGSTKLPAGEYKVSWTGTGSAVEVTFARKGLATVTVPAKAVESKSIREAQEYKTVNGVEVLQAIIFNNVKLEISGATPVSGE
jgi:hypothetical protein